MGNKVGFAIVGVGNMGNAHAQMMQKLDNVELVAVCDIREKAFDNLPADIRSKVQCYTDINQLWQNEAVQAVLIAVPHYFHVDIAIDAMEHGRHIIVEKPISVHKAEAERLIEACKKHPELIRSAMFNQRTLPAHKKLKSLIDNGELGKINRVNWIVTDWFRTQAYYDSGDWRATWAGEGGGVLLNQCPHQLDLMQWLFGMPSMVCAQVKIGKYHDIEVEDEVNAYLEYPNGCVGNFITTTGETPGTNRLEIAAEKGRVVLEGGKISFIRNEEETSAHIKNATRGFSRPEVWECSIPFNNNMPHPQHATVVQNVANAILKGEKLIAPVEEGINGLELGNAMLMSGLKKQPVTLPIDSAEYAEILAGLIASSTRSKKESKESAAAANMSSTY
ncbi:MAG: Gfo/Idh/MocA family oxidoreductase [Lentisphaeria bacterium]|nr:Gfo/Idh/MocA family oxidoreductase [Lentisphaeria bacterium]